MKSGKRHRNGVKKIVRKRRKNVVAKKRSSARLKLAGDKKHLSKIQTRAVWRSPGLALVAPSATNLWNVTIGANVATEKMPL